MALFKFSNRDTEKALLTSSQSLFFHFVYIQDISLHTRQKVTFPYWMWPNLQLPSHSLKKSITLSWRRPLSYRNQSIDFGSKSVDWFLYDSGLRHERVKEIGKELFKRIVEVIKESLEQGLDIKHIITRLIKLLLSSLT